MLKYNVGKKQKKRKERDKRDTREEQDTAADDMRNDNLRWRVPSLRCAIAVQLLDAAQPIWTCAVMRTPLRVFLSYKMLTT